ncbi:glycoside hydrolase family 47 protein [Pseudocercospora fijiensis CIRAD86]|uniref:alpha-1,2-Mannosidase n=1 Tax=Pseudocercospora fijiensis (strain CIRAD86) TaxID=383855 RepID=M3B363_PSEFD|nr:glycoside hydrolase family 47 protein [Pseudocercospora fijiensis CIRAD86]EME83807.1 glycoside hydrolase family 47 protein [Pseudocercospora fijiensis CIRAD86]
MKAKDQALTVRGLHIGLQQPICLDFAIAWWCLASFPASCSAATIQAGDGRQGRTGSSGSSRSRNKEVYDVLHPGLFKPKFKWRNVKQNHPVQTYTELPTGPSVTIPQIQHDFAPEKLQHAVERRKRLRAVEDAFHHSWQGYKRNAWLSDEVSPLTGHARNPFGGWGATLVDTLDTLWIMGMEKEFATAVSAIKHLDFAVTDQYEVNVFETTIRYLGGLMSAYDISGHNYKILLQKAVELGDMLYLAFDTPNRMPVTRWAWQQTVLGNDQEAKKFSLLAEVGSLTLEFTRLSQLTGNPKWYDAVARITNLLEASQNETKIPGLWPTFVDAKGANFKRDSTFTLGGMADSLYEYLPKQHLMLAGQTEQYRNMYSTALAAAKQKIFFRPQNPDGLKMLLPGTVKRYSSKNIKLLPQAEHLACFAGGMVGLAAKIFQRDEEMTTARELVDGCIWAYESMPSGIMPEVFTALPCEQSSAENCTWNETEWHRAVVEKANRGYVPEEFTEQAQTVIQQNNLAPGFSEITDSRYLLRPEAIESVFVLYRITGDDTLQDKAWEMFQAITKHTKTEIAFAALKDVTKQKSELVDNMESFWTAETLKYFYLIFSEPDMISLDDYVFNTEAHPLLRPK